MSSRARTVRNNLRAGISGFRWLRAHKQSAALAAIIAPVANVQQRDAPRTPLE